MPSPIEICLENIDLGEVDERYLRCVALPDAEPGLSLSAEGDVVWMPETPGAATGLWVSADDRLMLMRPACAEPIWVERAGRSVEAPCGKPVVLLHEDLLRIGERRLRVHVHGPTEEIFAPEPVPASVIKRLAQSAAAALALGAAAISGTASAGSPVDTNTAPIEVRQRPPAPRPPPRHPVNCKIQSIKPGKSGITVQATCPASTAGKLFKGMRGTLLHADKTPIREGAVVVAAVNKTNVVATGKKSPKVKAVYIRLMVHKFR